MAISFVGSYSGTHAATTTQTIAFANLRNASGNAPILQEGDLVIVGCNNAGTTNLADGVLTPTGYTAIFSPNLYANDSNDTNFQVCYKFMGATPDTSVGIRASNSTANGFAYTITVLRGVDPNNPLDVAAVSDTGNNTGVANPPAITPVTAGAWILGFGAAGVAAGAVFTNPAGSGWSTTTNHFRSSTITTTTVDANICVSIKTDWTSGAFDAPAYGGSTTTNTGSWAAATLALRPRIDPPFWNSPSTVSVAENSKLAYTMDATNSPTYSIVGGTDSTSFELSGTTLRWAGDGTKDYEAPGDANGDNIYDVTLRAVNGGGSADLTVSVTVTDVVETVGGTIFDDTQHYPTFVTLSNGGLTATGSTGINGNYGNVRATTPKSSGKLTYSFTFDTFAANSTDFGGASTAAPDFTGIWQFASNAGTFAWRIGGPGGATYAFWMGATFYDLRTINGGGYSQAPTGPGHEYQIILDLDNALLYLAVDGSPISGMDPVAGTGGIPITLTGAIYPAISHGDVNVATIDPTPSYLPSSFSPWDSESVQISPAQYSVNIV